MAIVFLLHFISAPVLKFTQTTNSCFHVSEDRGSVEGHFSCNILGSSEVIADGLPTSGKQYWELEADVKLKGPRDCYVRYTTGVVHPESFHVDKAGRRPWGVQLDFGSRGESEIGYGISTSLRIPGFLSTSSPDNSVNFKLSHGFHLDWEKRNFLIVDCLEDEILFKVEPLDSLEALVPAVGVHVAFDVEAFVSIKFVQPEKLSSPNVLTDSLR